MHVNSHSLLIQFNLNTKKITKKKDSKFKIITSLFEVEKESSKFYSPRLENGTSNSVREQKFHPSRAS